MLIALSAVLSACSAPPPPPAAASGPRLAAEGLSPARVLSPEQQAEALAALRSSAEGHEPGDPFLATPAPTRWSDVPLALAAACDEVEMAVVRREETAGGAVFHVLTIRDQEGQLTVERGEMGDVGAVSAVIGRFGDAEAERRLLEAFARWLDRFGRKRVLRGS